MKGKCTISYALSDWVPILSCFSDDFLDEITEDLEMRKRLRPLLDTIQQINRSRK
jgi:hypothetical protein